jgi:tetratricopeptide (TPR) repeat protein
MAHLGAALVGVERAEEALATVAEALAWSPGSEERAYRAEFSRIQGEALLRRATPDQEAATACLEEAIELAREQGARVFELWAVTSLARLCQQQGRAAAAHDRLASAIGWFTEGLDLSDLQTARLLLGELSTSVAP